MPRIGLYKNVLGSTIVTSVCSFGYIDANTSFFSSTGQLVLPAGNAVHEEAVLVEAKNKDAKIVNINCVIDHRYLYSDRRGKDLISKEIFENPQLYH